MGSITDLSDTAGLTIQHYKYDSFGNVIEQVGDIENNYTYTGRELDKESGLYFYRARYYPSDTGRFITVDPIGFIGGLNLYAYVGNNPMNWIDPFGLTQEDVDRAKEVLKEFYPEYYNEEAEVSFDDFNELPPGDSAGTDIWTGDIELKNEYKEELSGPEKEALLTSLAHEYQHSNDSILQRILDDWFDTDNHDDIFDNAEHLSEEANEAMCK